MTEFTFDTSGTVWTDGPIVSGGFSRSRTSRAWSDLSPFAQGYVEALFAPLATRGDPIARCGFSDLSPEALALILRDCEDYGRYFRGTTPFKNGGNFWANRQFGHLRNVTNDGVTRHFPPLTPTLGDDGKVYLTETSHDPR